MTGLTAGTWDPTLIKPTKPLHFLEPVQDLDQGMQRKAKLVEKAQHTWSM
ncbi:MAG: hypothetical protein ACRER2_15550 [Methylococcales bacterium]